MVAACESEAILETIELEKIGVAWLKRRGAWEL